MRKAEAILFPLHIYSRVALSERGGYRLVRAFRKVVPKREWVGYFNVGENIIMNLDLEVYPDCCMAVALYELDTIRVLRRLLKSGTRFLDVGANIGYFSLLAARWVGQDGQVDSVEPDPINRARLEEHLALNGLAQEVRIHAIAATDRKGDVRLWHPEEGAANHGMASIIYPTGSGAKAYLVKARRLDEAISCRPDVIKMDIEGSELLALRGMNGWLCSDKPPILIIEHNPVSAANANWRCGDLLRHLRELNQDWRAVWLGWRSRPLSGPDEIDSIRRQGNILYSC